MTHRGPFQPLLFCDSVKDRPAPSLPHQLPEELPAKATAGKATSPLLAPPQPTICPSQQGPLFAQHVQAVPTVTGSCSRSWLPSTTRWQGPAAAGATAVLAIVDPGDTLPRLCARHPPRFGEPSHRSSPQSLPAPHLV